MMAGITQRPRNTPLSSPNNTFSDDINNIPLRVPNEDAEPSAHLMRDGNKPVSSSILSLKRKESPHFAKWGVTWWQRMPMVSTAFTGILLAIGHHFYYNFLNGTTAGSSDRQQWSLNIGSAFAFAAVALLKTASDAAYKQYIWTTIKRKPISIGSLDRLFTLTSDPFGFLKLELWMARPLAVILGLTCWCLTLGGVAPPGTLTVIPVLINTTVITSVKTLSFSRSPNDYDFAWSQVSKIASQAAVDMRPVSLAGPAANASYNLQFFGPALQCGAPNKTQDAIFDYFSESFHNSTNEVNLEQYNKDLGWTSLQVFSAFSPQLSLLEGPGEMSSTYNWFPALPVANPSEDVSSDGINSLFNTSIGQYWIYLADQNIVCNFANASFDIEFNYVNGDPEIVQRNVEITGDPDFSNGSFSLSFPGLTWYEFVYQAMGNQIYGNLSFAPNVEGTNDFIVHVDNTTVLNTGLIGCDEFINNTWFNIPIKSSSTMLGLAPWTKPIGSFDFGGKPSMCRNRTIGAALEDLAINTTLSMLTYSNVTTDTEVPVTYSTTQNAYSYNSSRLFISYGIAILFTLATVFIGLVSLQSNGVSHSNTFSAILSTTRNPDLDIISKGHSLGTTELTKEFEDAEVMFGGIERGVEKYGGGGNSELYHEVRHLAFGLKGTVVPLRKGGVYT